MSYHHTYPEEHKMATIHRIMRIYKRKEVKKDENNQLLNSSKSFHERIELLKEVNNHEQN